MRLHVALAAALLCVIGVFALEMSGSAPRLAGTDHVDPLGFVGPVPASGRVCQSISMLPSDTGSVKLLVGTYGRPLPVIDAEFVGPSGALVTDGERPAGGKQGYVEVPLRYPHGPSSTGSLCFRIHGRRVAIGGQPLAASATVNGKPASGALSLYYVRYGRESWWELLSTLVRRFGFGKAAFFGDWTLPAMALLLLATWFATIKLLAKEAA